VRYSSIVNEVPRGNVAGDEPVKKLERGKRTRKDIEGLLSFEVAAADLCVLKVPALPWQLTRLE